MPMLEKFFKPKPKETDEQRWAKIDKENAERVEQERTAAIEKARQEDAADLARKQEKFQEERPRLERRLQDIPAEIKNLEEGLKNMTGPEMRRILDREFELNSKLSPVDSTDPTRAVEYDMWKRAIEDGRRATQSLKQNLQSRIDDYRKKIGGLEREKTETERRIQRGY